MRKAMEKWLNQRQITFDPNTANSICDKFGLDGEKADECIGLCYQLEADKITQAEFTGGLCVLTGKEPEEVMGILKGVKGTRPKMTLDELDKKAIALYIKRHGREAYESGEIGETLERIDQPAEEYDPVFLSKHPELKGKSITVYHDPLAGEDWAVVNNETGEVVEIFAEEVMGVLGGATASLGLRVVLSPDEYDNPRWGEMATRNYAKSLGWTEKVTGDIAWRNPRNRKQEIRFIGATREPKTITIYNSKGNERETISVEKEVMGVLKGVGSVASGNSHHKRSIPHNIEVLVPGDMTKEERVRRWIAYMEARIEAVNRYEESKSKARRDALKHEWDEATYKKAIAEAQRIFHEEAEVKAREILRTPIDKEAEKELY